MNKLQVNTCASMSIPPQTIRHCHTTKELEGGKNAVSKGREDQSCQIKDYRVKGNSATRTYLQFDNCVRAARSM